MLLMTFMPGMGFMNTNHGTRTIPTKYTRWVQSNLPGRSGEKTDSDAW